MTTKKNSAAGSATEEPRKRSNPEGVPFTTLTAKQAQKASVRARNMRTQMRARMLEHLVTNYDFPDEILKALRQGNLDQVELITKAMRLIGLTHDQSEEAVQKVSLDAKTDATVNQTVRFCLAPRPEKTPETKE